MIGFAFVHWFVILLGVGGVSFLPLPLPLMLLLLGLI